MKRYLTDSSHRVSELTIRPSHTVRNPEMNLVKVYPTLKRQSIIGFGAALTEASGYVYSRMKPENRMRFIELCFGSNESAYSLCRLSIQSCDFSLAPRSYIPKRGSWDHFSIDDDWAYVLPLVMDAKCKAPQLHFLASPWSPPSWAKTNRSMKRGGRLRRSCYRDWARIIAQSIYAYRDEGINISRITVQNEPQAIQAWESCLYSPSQEGSFLNDYLRPALERLNLSDIKTFIWDHNKESMLDRAQSIANAYGASSFDGVAFHWYSGDHFDAVRATREMLGDSHELIFTEGCDSYSAGNPTEELPHAEHYAHEIIGDFEAGANGFIDWNILLDSNGGPNHVGNFCDAPLMYDYVTEKLRVRLPYYYLQHFSRFIKPGAQRIVSTGYTTDLETCAAINPDGSMALVVMNRTDHAIEFDLTWPDQGLLRAIAHIDASPHSIQTICW